MRLSETSIVDALLRNDKTRSSMHKVMVHVEAKMFVQIMYI
jgi:hypothetical protein